MQITGNFDGTRKNETFNLFEVQNDFFCKIKKNLNAFRCNFSASGIF